MPPSLETYHAPDEDPRKYNPHSKVHKELLKELWNKDTLSRADYAGTPRIGPEIRINGGKGPYKVLKGNSQPDDTDVEERGLKPPVSAKNGFENTKPSV